MSSESSVVSRAKALLESVTPLQFDCGRLCGSACCAGDENDGMFLFPGEICRVSGAEVSEIPVEGFPGKMRLMVCVGTCRHEDRPLACRLFPLMAVRKADGSLGVRTDARGRPVCPLCRQPVAALSPDFVNAVREAFRILSEDPEQRAFLDALMAHENAFRLKF